MAAIVTNLTQAIALDANTMTSAAVGGADTGFPIISDSFPKGIDGTTNCSQLTNEATNLVAGDHYSAWITLSGGPYDMSAVDQSFTFHFKNNAPSFNSIETNSDSLWLILFSDSGTTNYGRWNFDPTNLIDGVFYPITAVGTPDATGGTFDDTNITGMGIAVEAKNTDVFGFQISVDQCIAVDGPAVFEDTGGAATVTALDYYNLLKPDSGETYHSLLVRRAGPAFEFGFPIEIAADDYVETDPVVLTFRDTDDREFPTMASGYYQLLITGQASGTFTMPNASLSNIAPDYNLTIDGSAASTDITMTSCLAAGVNTVSITGSGVTMVGCTVASPASCEIADGDLDLTITDSTAAINWSADLTAGSTITTDSDIDVGFDIGNYNDITVNFTANADFAVDPSTDAGEYDFEGITTTANVHFDNDSANDTTINVASALTFDEESPTTGGGDLQVDQPVDTFTINSSETGSFIQIFTTATQTVLASTTGSTLAYEFGGTVVVDYVVQKAGFLPQRTVGLTLTDATETANLVADPVYDASHGLTYTTDASWSRTNNELTVPTFGPSVRGVHSLMIDSFIAETTLYNTAYNIQMNGNTSLFLTNDAEGVSDATIENMMDGGVRYVNTAGTTTAEWPAIQSTGIATGFQGEYQQQDGTGTTNARATGAFDELVKSYGDASHGNFDYRDHLVLKFQVNGYRQSEADIPAIYEISAVEPVQYVVGMEPIAIPGLTLGDPSPTGLTLTDHGASPVSWDAGDGAKDYSITITDTGANSGETILRWLNYNLSLDATFESKDPFNWPEMVLDNGAAYETLRGIVHGGTGAALKGVRVIDGSADPHSDFTRFQADDGTYGTPPVTATGTVSSIVNGSQLRILNTTTATETYNDVPGTSFVDNYTEGTTYTDGDVIEISITRTDGVTAYEEFFATVIATSTGWTVIAAQVSDAVYDANGVDGSTLGSKFSANYGTGRVNSDDGLNWTAVQWYAWWVYQNTTEDGIRNFFGVVNAIDAANFEIDQTVVDLLFDNTTTTNNRQTDTPRIFRKDGAYPVVNPATSGGGGIDIQWQERVFIAETGVSGLTAPESTQLFSVGTPAENATATMASIIEGTVTLTQSIRLINSAAAAKTNGAGTTNIKFRDLGDTKDRIDAIVDVETGERTAVTLDVT